VVILRDQIHRELMYRRFQFQKCCQDFFGSHNEMLSVAIRVYDPGRSSFNIES